MSAEEMKKIQAMLELNGLDIELTEEIIWNPGDPVNNNGQAMLRHDFLQNSTEEEVQKYYPEMFRATDGTMRDMRFTAPELFPEPTDQEKDG